MDLDFDVLLFGLLAATTLGVACYVLLDRVLGSGRRISHAAAHARDSGLSAAAGRRAAAAAQDAGLLGGLFARLRRRRAAQEAGEPSALRLRLRRAGLRDADAGTRFAGTRLLLTLALPVMAAGIYVVAANEVSEALLAAAALMAAMAGWCLPSLWLDARAARRQRELASNFPDAIDMIRLCVEAGQGLDAAMTRVEREIRLTCVPLYEELHSVNLEMRAGAGRARALKNMAQRIGLPEVDALVSMLVQVERLGTSVADALRIHADVLRTRRRQRAQEQAAKVPVKLLFPMIFCIFPALLIVLLGPAAISVVRTLSTALVPG